MRRTATNRRGFALHIECHGEVAVGWSAVGWKGRWEKKMGERKMVIGDGQLLLACHCWFWADSLHHGVPSFQCSIIPPFHHSSPLPEDPCGARALLVRESAIAEALFLSRPSASSLQPGPHLDHCKGQNAGRGSASPCQVARCTRATGRRGRAQTRLAALGAGLSSGRW